MDPEESLPELHLSPQDQAAFAEALINPPEPNEALRQLFRNQGGEA